MVKHRNDSRAERGSVLGRNVVPSLVAVFVLSILPASAFAQAMLSRGSSVNSINIGPRTPNININPNITIGPSINPTVRYSPNLNMTDGPPVQAAPRYAKQYNAGSPADTPRGGGPTGRAKKPVVAATDSRFVAKELVIEVLGSPSDTEAEAIARRHRLTRIQAQNFPLIDSTLFRWRIPDGRSVNAVVRELVADNTVRSAQPNYRYTLQQTTAAAPVEGDPAQYALEKLHLPEAHTLARGSNVTVAVIDSGIDAGHPELMGAIGSTFDALGGKAAAHAHGTGIAGVIASHSRLMGSSPSANILAIRAFGVADGATESTSFVILKSLDFAVSHGARVINMSFARPEDALVGRGLAAAAAKGVVLVAASGNAGPKSPPLFPAADRSVIAVTATDASDRLFPASNRGSYVAIAAPGVDILTSAPDAKYQVASGTSFAAAYVSGMAALMLERNSSLKPEDVRSILTKTAHDLGAPGRDDLFGAGKADAFGAVSAAGTPIATASDQPSTISGPDQPMPR
jgi:subtilisin family serine protease